MDFISISNQLSNFQRAFLLRFYRSQFWRPQKLDEKGNPIPGGFIGRNFGDYKNYKDYWDDLVLVLSVAILETTKTVTTTTISLTEFYRSQFWRLQKRIELTPISFKSFIGRNFGDYKNFTSPF